ncbi:MAG: mevalonate kinase [Caldilineales bacterium]|nr:mevalonate kinase [Caldilineales bacterium]
MAAAHAPGKIILFGEHAVVYGRPAIAVPLSDVRAYASVFPAKKCRVRALDLNRTVDVGAAADDDPFALIVRLLCAELGQPLPAWRLDVRSDIPIASGLGSGAAIATAIARALLAGFGAEMEPSRLSALVYEVEKLHHGTPSGIDNNVVVYERPIWFVRDQQPEFFSIGSPLHLLVADTGIPSPTRHTVAAVRQGWQANKSHYESLFDAIAEICHAARDAIRSGHAPALGQLMTQNQTLLSQIGVSSPELDRLCRAASVAGALGAKLSGGGGGGNMIALTKPENTDSIIKALKNAGAARTLQVTVS